jgi:glutathionyl-hydroquinone reductase
VSNESAEIIRMFYTEFDDIIEPKYRDVKLLPDDLKTKIEETNEWTYPDINNGVYRSGFATSAEAYEKAVTQLFKSLDRVEEHLSKNADPYYYGKNITEADVRLYTTIIRFDPVYVQHFKTNIRDIRSGYPAIHKWMRNLYWNVPAFGKETTLFDHIKYHYTRSHKQYVPLCLYQAMDLLTSIGSTRIPLLLWVLSHIFSDLTRRLLRSKVLRSRSVALMC